MQKTANIHFLFFLMIALLHFGCGKDASATQNVATQKNEAVQEQPADQPVSKEIVLNGLTWTTENLNVPLNGSWCYDDNPGYCRTFGRLYSWGAAVEACKSLGEGWRLPTEEEATAMISQFGEMGISPIGTTPSAFQKLLEGGEVGFNMLRGGTRTFNGYYTDLGDMGYFWTATPTPGYEDTYRAVFFQNATQIVNYINFSVKQGASCRCVK